MNAPLPDGLTLALKAKWTRPQWDLISFRAPPNERGEAQVEIAAGVGQYGGGKSYGGAGRCIDISLANPFDPNIHTEEDPPATVIVGPSLAALLEGAFAHLMEITPPELILRKRLYGVYFDVTLINGHVWRLKAARGAIEGGSVVHLWADDIQHSSYEGKWHNLQARARDKRARRLAVTATGISRPGWISDVFRRPAGEARKTVIFRASDNARNLGAGVAKQLLASLPASETETDADGWMMPADVCWPKFGDANLARAPSLEDRRDRPTSFGVDLRSHAAVVFVQPEPVVCMMPRSRTDETLVPRDEMGLLVVDQYMPDGKSAEDIALAIKRSDRWRIVPGKSKMAFDPSASIDEIEHFRRLFPGVEIVQVRSGPYHEGKTGRRAVDRAIKDGLGNTRLFVHPGLVGRNRRGIPEALRAYSEKDLHDDFYEHAADAGRYIAQAFLPMPDHRFAGMDVTKQNERTAIWAPT